MADIAAVTVAGGETDLASAAVDAFASSLRGQLLRPGDPRL
jgi:hypothetical protein